MSTSENSVGWSLAILALGIIALPYDAFVVMKLWNWFAVPAGARMVGFWVAFGIDLIFGYLVVQFPTPKNPDETARDRFNGALARRIGFAFLLGIGLFAHSQIH